MIVDGFEGSIGRRRRLKVSRLYEAKVKGWLAREENNVNL